MRRLLKAAALLHPRALMERARFHARLIEHNERLLQQIEALTGEVRALASRLDTVALREQQLRAIVQSDISGDDRVLRFQAALDEDALAGHIRASIARATLHLDPFPYCVVDRLLPRTYYDALIEAIPPVDLFGVGTNLSVSYDAPTLGGVYKLVEQVVDGRVQYKMKLSAEKATYPGRKQVWRKVAEKGDYLYDVVGLMDEEPPEESFPLLEQFMRDGRLCVQYPTLKEIQQRARENLQRLPARYRKIENAEVYEVRFSQRLEELHQRVLAELKEKGV